MRTPAAPRVACVKAEASLPRLLILHLFPGALLTVVYAVGGSLWAARDVPPLLILMLGVAVVVVPFELGVLLRAPRQATGWVSLRDVVEWWGPTPASGSAAGLSQSRP